MDYKYRLYRKVVFFVLFGVLLMGCSGGRKSSSQSGENNHNNTSSSLVISAVQPANGAAGSAISITGTGFGAVQGTVNIDTTTAVINSWSDTSINAVVPDIAAGSVKLSVVSGTQTSNIDFMIMPFISGISKTDVLLNDTIVITGTGFGTMQGGSTIDYAGTVLPVTSWSNNQITASIGNMTHAAAGQVNMIVNNAVSNGITLTVHPSISGITPDTAERGDDISITGDLFGTTQGASGCTFAGSNAVILSWSDNLIRARVPDTAVKGEVVVTVNTITSSAQGFTVTKTFYSLNQPTGLALDDGGSLYAANYTNGTIIKVLPGGLTQTTLYKGLNQPMGLYYRAPSTLFVACAGDGTVQRLTLGTQVTGYTYASGFSIPAGVAFDDAGNMYVTNYGNNTIAKVDLNNAVSTFAAGLNKPMGIVFTGPAGGKTFYVINSGNSSISIVNLGGVVAPYVSSIDAPKYLISDSAYNLYLTSGNNIIKVLSPSGQSIIYATGLSNPYGLAIDSAGHVYVSDFDTNTISKTNSDYQVYAKGFNNPWGVTFSSSGTMFVSNQGTSITGGGSISMVTTDGRVLPFVNPFERSACGGSDGSRPKVVPMGITIGFQNNLYVSNSGNYGSSPGDMSASTVSEVTMSGNAHVYGSCLEYIPAKHLCGISFSSGSGLLYVTDQSAGSVFTLPSTPVKLYNFASGFISPKGIAIDPSGSVYVANAGNGTISQTTSAGTFTSTFVSGFSQPSGIAFDSAGNLYVASYGDDSVALVTPAKQIYTIATGIPDPNGLAMDGEGIMYVASETGGRVYRLIHTMSPYASGFNAPQGLTKGTDGIIYIADSANSSIYHLDPSGALTALSLTHVSPSWFVFDNDGSLVVSDFTSSVLLKLFNGGLNTFATGLNGPEGIAYDSLNNLFYSGNYLDGTLTVINGFGNVSIFAVGLYGPMGVALLSPGNLYVANSSNGTIAKVVQGSGVSTFATGFGMPVGVTLDGANNLYVSDKARNAIFVISNTGAVLPFAEAASPFGIAFDGDGNLFVSDTQNKQIKEIILHE